MEWNVRKSYLALFETLYGQRSRELRHSAVQRLGGEGERLQQLGLDDAVCLAPGSGHIYATYYVLGVRVAQEVEERRDRDTKN